MKNNLYEFTAGKIVNHYIRKNRIEPNEKDIYSYSFEVLLSLSVNIIIIVFLSIITNTFIPSFFFILGFTIVRSFAGGYHATTYLKCHIMTLINHLLFIIIYFALHYFYPYNISCLLLILSALLIYFFAPVDHKNKRFIKNEQKKYRTLCVIYSFLLLLTVFIIILIIRHIKIYLLSQYLFGFSIGTASASIAMVIAVLKNRKEIDNE